jgi:exodeoxyribonuclease V alpha subunit
MTPPASPPAQLALSGASDERAAVLATLGQWAARGTLRRLDGAFAAFMADLCPDAPPAVVLAAALVANVEGAGHSCMPLDSLMEDPEGTLGWAEASVAEYRDLSARLGLRLEDWLAALRHSPLVWIDDAKSIRSHDSRAAQPAQADTNQPLVLRGAKLYLRRYWRYERRVAARVLVRVATPMPVDEARARTWLGRLFPSSTGSVDWQKVACAVALRSGLSVITGGPGTGKTYTAARLLALLLALEPHPDRLRIALAAPTGKAAARLRQSIGSALAALQASVDKDLPLATLVSAIGPARTLHSLLGARPDTRVFRHDAANPLEVDVLIVDEASMIHLEMMAALLEALPANARLVLIGDKDQLASVEAGAVLGELCRDAERGRYRPETAEFLERVMGQPGQDGQLLPAGFVSDGPPLAQQTVMLRESRRFAGRIGRLASAANTGDVEAASALFESAGDGELLWVDAQSVDVAVQLAVQGRAGAPGGYGGADGYLELLKQRPAVKGDLLDAQAFESWAASVLEAFDRFRLLCAVHEGEWGTQHLNREIERALAAKRLINRRSEWYEGRPIMVTRNDPGAGVFNGDVGIVLRPMNGASPRAWFLDGAAIRSVAVSRLEHVETAFAMTVHKSQGSEFEHTALVLPRAPSRVLTRELVYTGITRARSRLTLVTGRAQALADALGQRTRRSSGLRELLRAGESG